MEEMKIQNMMLHGVFGGYAQGTPNSGNPET